MVLLATPLIVRRSDIVSRSLRKREDLGTLRKVEHGGNEENDPSENDVLQTS